MTRALVVTDVRPVDLATGTIDPRTCLRIRDGVITDRGDLTPGPDEELLDGAGGYALPGLWDRHVHLDTWASMAARLDLYDTSSEEEVLDAVAQHLVTADPSAAVIAMGYRSSSWDHVPLTSALDAVAGDRPVALISGDGHNGWLSSAALRMLDLDPARHPTALHEDEWFPVLGSIGELEPAEVLDARVRQALRDAASLGVTGVVDMEFGDAPQRWARRGITGVRVRAAVYPTDLRGAIAEGRSTGTPFGPLAHQGPLKIISDGSLGTLTAHCCQPYVTPAGDRRLLAHPCGVQNVPADELVGLLASARQHGLEVAVHAIGDAAVDIALDAFEATGAVGGIEHAQLISAGAASRMAALGVEASVQPAHLLDDATTMDRVWADRTDRAFALRALLDEGVVLALGSDAPVAPLNPWRAIDAAVDRGPTAWHPEQAITRREALLASTDGVSTLAPGGPGDLVIVDDDPLRASPAGAVRSTVCAGTTTHRQENAA